MRCLCTGSTVRAKAARAEAARRHGTYITCRAGACRAVPPKKTARENPSGEVRCYFSGNFDGLYVSEEEERKQESEKGR